MKKILLILLLAVVTGGNAWAQKNMQGIGANATLNIGEDGVGIGGSLKYQYNLSNYFRLEPSFSYYSVDDDGFDATFLLNGHLFFFSPRPFRPYFFAGIGYVDFQELHHFYNEVENTSDFGVNAGLGIDWRMSHVLSLQVEVGPLIGVSDDDEFAGRLNIGLTYNF